MAVNCWEFKECGRPPGGHRVAELGPASTAMHMSGVNHGANARRYCWAVSGTFCGGAMQGTFAQKQATCLSCEFYRKVKEEQGGTFVLLARVR